MLEFKDQPEKKKKKQKIVKHRRKNWSKIDISEVEQGIDDVKHQELSGGVRAEKKDEELFYISKTKLTDDAASEQVPSKKKKLSFEEKLKDLKCYRNLLPDPHSAPAHVFDSRQESEPDSRRQIKKREILARKSKAALKFKKLPDCLPQQKDIMEAKKCDVQLESSFNKDLWNTSDLPKITHVNEYYLRSTKKLLPKRPESMFNVPSKLPKIEAPHPGTSYNPDYDDHQDLLLKAHLIELQKLNEEQKLLKRMSANAKKMSWKEMEDLWMQEMSVKDLFDQEDESKEESESDDGESESPNAPTSQQLKKSVNSSKAKKMTKAKRERKRLLEKIRIREKENEKKIRIQQNEIFRIKSILKEVNAEEKKKQEELAQRAKDKEHREMYEAKRLNSLKYEDAELALKLSDEITGNLRNLKPEGDILVDRYKSMQKRNLIEPRQRAKKNPRKYWTKKFDKQNAYEKTHYIK